MSELYYVSPEDRRSLTESGVVLTGAEAKHLSRVMRKKVGDRVLLFDGAGREFDAEIIGISRDRVECRIFATRADDREPNLALTVLLALPKGERQKWAIEKLSELGVRRVVPFDAERADVKFDESVRERLERQVLEASKQCGRLRLMSITPSVGFGEFRALVELLEARTSGAVELSESARALADRFRGFGLFDEFKPGDEVARIAAHPRSDGDFGQTSFAELARSFGDKIPRGALIMIGPVGGLTDAEIGGAVEQGWRPLDLGKQVYRVETAAIVASALLLHLD